MVAAVPYSSAPAIGTLPSGRVLAFDVYSSRSTEVGRRFAALLSFHASSLGDPGDTTATSIVDFPSDPKTWLSFVSAGVIVLSHASVSSFVNGEPRGYELAAHEAAHLWFGVALRPRGPALRWLLESFAEYYAWRALAREHGAEALQKYVEAATTESDAHPVRIDSLGFDTDLVYTRGTLGVAALARAVGEAQLDRAIRDIGARRADWTVESLFTTLARQSADADAIRGWRSNWGL